MSMKSVLRKGQHQGTEWIATGKYRDADDGERFETSDGVHVQSAGAESSKVLDSRVRR